MCRMQHRQRQRHSLLAVAYVDRLLAVLWCWWACGPGCCCCCGLCGLGACLGCCLLTHHLLAQLPQASLATGPATCVAQMQMRSELLEEETGGELSAMVVDRAGEHANRWGCSCYQQCKETEGGAQAYPDGVSVQKARWHALSMQCRQNTKCQMLR
jgi:hypothetical protein